MASSRRLQDREKWTSSTPLLGHRDQEGDGMISASSWTADATPPSSGGSGDSGGSQNTLPDQPLSHATSSDPLSYFPDGVVAFPTIETISSQERGRGGYPSQSDHPVAATLDEFGITRSGLARRNTDADRSTLGTASASTSIHLYDTLSAPRASDANGVRSKVSPDHIYATPIVRNGMQNVYPAVSSTLSTNRSWSNRPGAAFMGTVSSFTSLHSDKVFDEDKLFPTYQHGFQEGPEDDDMLHDPTMLSSAGNHYDDSGHIFTVRGLLNVGTLALIASGLAMLFAGYPILAFVLKVNESKKGGYNLGGINATGQIPHLFDLPSLIDKDTPREVYTRRTMDGRRKMNLVFSDEFNVNGRSFYPGDDPFWEAVNLHYWGTGNYEWYDPAAVTTVDGQLVITLEKMPINGLDYRGGMITSWNKMCFTGGYIEVSVVLPGSPDISGLWPAAWTMGNLGRAGYGATTDGMWPYSYDECDVGTLPNQTWPRSMGGGPVAAETTGVWVEQYGPGLSYLPGQRLSRCTCPAYEDHPGPRHSDGSYVGRSAPEIDIIEAQASNEQGRAGHVSMSLQVAPFDSGYNLTTAEGAYDFVDSDAVLNSYTGSVYQQAASGLITTDRANYEDNGKTFSTYGFEYKPGDQSDSYVTWTKEGRPMWTLHSSGLGPNPATEVGQRTIPPEPMYVLLNLGMSKSFTYVNFDELHFPAKYYIDYIRIWQVEGEENLGCDPPDFPTFDYINRHWEAYNNPNLTTWDAPRQAGGYNKARPPNRLVQSC